MLAFDGGSGSLYACARWWAFRKLTGAQLGQKTRLFDSALEAADSNLERLVFLANVRHNFHPLPCQRQPVVDRLYAQIFSAELREAGQYSRENLLHQVLKSAAYADPRCQNPPATKPASRSTTAPPAAFPMPCTRRWRCTRRVRRVVPELASRDHIRRVVPLLREALERRENRWTDIDAVAYTRGPGLAGALLVGCAFAEALALAIGKPTIPVHHLGPFVVAAAVERSADLPVRRPAGLGRAYAIDEGDRRRPVRTARRRPSMMRPAGLRQSAKLPACLSGRCLLSKLAVERERRAFMNCRARCCIPAT